MVICAALAQPAIAQTTAQDCAAVTNAAITGRNDANVQVEAMEQDLKTRVSAARACIEAFGAAGARLTVLMGGVDLAPIQNMVAQAACSIIQKGASSVTSAIPSVATPVYNAATQAMPTFGQAPPTSGAGFWQNLSNRILGGN